ncbi:MAG: RNA-binding protein [Deltaproteobacteria bacterium]|nr:RNA-binding protein [Deltaproteobacteria bacterium]
MGKRLYVGNLPYEITEDEIRQTFGPCGNITEVRIVTDKFTGRSRGFGFVEMSTDEEAARAVSELNDAPLGGRKLIVSEARTEGSGGGRGGHGGGGGGGGRRREGGGGGGGGFGNRRRYGDR